MENLYIFEDHDETCMIRSAREHDFSREPFNQSREIAEIIESSFSGHKHTIQLEFTKNVVVTQMNFKSYRPLRIKFLEKRANQEILDRQEFFEEQGDNYQKQSPENSNNKHKYQSESNALPSEEDLKPIDNVKSDSFFNIEFPASNLEEPIHRFRNSIEVLFFNKGNPLSNMDIARD